MRRESGDWDRKVRETWAERKDRKARERGRAPVAAAERKPGRPRPDFTVADIKKLFLEDGKAVAEIAAAKGVSQPTIYNYLKDGGVELTRGRRPKPKAPKAPRKPRVLRANGGNLARFVTYKAEPSRTMGLASDHPAVVEGRTLFPTTVVPTAGAKHFLIDGKNSAKIGGRVLRGPWAGMPVFTLTLEERKTCPRACHQWQTCYGNAMQWPHRHDAADPDFMPALACEVVTVGRMHPAGFVVRLHVLGDFFSVAYVRVWGHLLSICPSLHVYGYTARRTEDPESERIALELEKITEAHWDRFAIRTSHDRPGRQRTIVVTEPVEAPDVIMCPQQTDATATCGTCALCWSPNARDKTVAFLLHGMKRGGRQ